MTVDPGSNRITGSPYSYDLSGNMTNDGLNALTYDAENRAVSAAGAAYTYDGNGLRVKKISAGTTTVYIFSGTKVTAEYVNGAAPTSPTREYVYAGSQLLAKIEGGVTNYYMADRLSARITTDTNGNIAGQQAHYPFGESWYASSTTTKWQFTSYERDTESVNDYATFRYDVNRLGRFSSPDPLAGSVTNPQSLNRYAYVLGDPGNLIDPLGLQCRRKVDDCEGNRGEGDRFANPFGTWDVFDLLAIVLGTRPEDCPDGDCHVFDVEDEPSLTDLLPQIRDFVDIRLDIGLGPSLRLPGESFGQCVDRVQEALLGETGQSALHIASGVSLFTAVVATPHRQTLAATNVIPGETNSFGAKVSADIIETSIQPKPSIAAEAISVGVKEGSVPSEVGAAFTKGANFLGKVSGIATAVGLGLEGGFAVACR